VQGTASRPKLLSQRVYLHLATDKPAPVEYLKWELIRQTGWTLEYIERLPMARWQEWLQVEDGKIHASHSLFNKK
jgi:hypothetical protein